MRRKQSKQKAKDRLRTEKERAAAEREAKQKADLEEAQKAATASKERDELERCCTGPLCCTFGWSRALDETIGSCAGLALMLLDEAQGCVGWISSTVVTLQAGSARLKSWRRLARRRSR